MSLKTFAKSIVAAATAPEPVVSRPVPKRPAFVPPEFEKGIIGKNTVHTKEHLVLINEVDRQCQNYLDFLMAHIDDRAYDCFVKQRQDIFDRVGAGKGDEVHASDSWSLDEWKDDFRLKRKGISLEIAKAWARLDPVLVEIAGNIAALAGVEGARLKASEDALAERYGMPHCSPLRLLLEGVAAHPSCLIPPTGSGRPKTILANFGITL